MATQFILIFPRVALKSIIKLQPNKIFIFLEKKSRENFFTLSSQPRAEKKTFSSFQECYSASSTRLDIDFPSTGSLFSPPEHSAWTWQEFHSSFVLFSIFPASEESECIKQRKKRFISALPQQPATIIQLKASRESSTNFKAFLRHTTNYVFSTTHLWKSKIDRHRLRNVQESAVSCQRQCKAVEWLKYVGALMLLEKFQGETLTRSPGVCRDAWRSGKNEKV